MADDLDMENRDPNGINSHLAVRKGERGSDVKPKMEGDVKKKLTPKNYFDLFNYLYKKLNFVFTRTFLH